mgnify:CR=1 FL=1
MTITRRQLQSVAIGCAALLLGAGAASAQTFGFATMQPGTLNHTTGSAIAKVLKDKANINAVIQPTAGESVLIPLVGRGEAEFGIANIFEVEGAKAANKDLRLIGSIQALRGAYFVRKDSGMKTMADLKGKRVVFGYSAMKTIDPLAKAMLMTGGLTEKDIKPVLVPNVIRGADEFAGMRPKRIDAFARRQARGDDVFNHQHARAGRNLEAATQRELAVLALDEDRLGAQLPCGLVTGNDAANRRRDDDVDLAERRFRLLGQGATELFRPFRILEDEHLLEEDGAAQPRRQNEMTFQKRACVAKFSEHFVLGHCAASWFGRQRLCHRSRGGANAAATARRDRRG